MQRQLMVLKTLYLPTVLISLLLAASCGEKQDKLSPKATDAEATGLAEENPDAVSEQPAVGSQEEKKDTNTLVLPDSYKVLAEATGDLDKDGIPERVVAFKDSPGQGEPSRGGLLIYRQENGVWKEWYKAFGPVLTGYEDDVMMGGAPFKGIDIERNAIVVHHYTSANSFTHRYRRNAGRWELIGATIVHESPRVSVDSHDYNLLTGDIEHRNTILGQTEEEEDKSTVSRSRKRLKTLPEMDGFVPGTGDDY